MREMAERIQTVTCEFGRAGLRIEVGWVGVAAVLAVFSRKLDRRLPGNGCHWRLLWLIHRRERRIFGRSGGRKQGPIEATAPTLAEFMHHSLVLADHTAEESPHPLAFWILSRGLLHDLPEVIG